MITVAHFYNELINHYDISTQENLGGPWPAESRLHPQQKAQEGQ